METPRIDHSITLEVAEQLIDGTKFPDIEGLMPGCFTTEILADRTPLGTVYGPKPSIRQVLAFHLKKSPEEITPQDFVEWWGQLTPRKIKGADFRS